MYIYRWRERRRESAAALSGHSQQQKEGVMY
jgi:hypothetical protein